MFIDFISWVSSQLLIVALVLFGISIYGLSIRRSKINTVKVNKKYKEFIIQEIDPKEGLHYIILFQQSTPKTINIYTVTPKSEELTARKKFKTLKHDLEDIILDQNTKFYHRMRTAKLIDKKNEKYDEIIEYVKPNIEKCEMDIEKCVIYRSRVERKIYISGKQINGKIIVNIVDENLDRLVDGLVPDRVGLLLGLSVWTIILCVVTKFLIYHFA